jgi:hypothetical protein
MASDTVNLIWTLGGELVTYTPFGQPPKTLRAIVERDRTAIDAQDVNGTRYAVNNRHVLIANDADNGVLSVLEHKDKIRFKKNVSDAAETDFTVQTVLKQDVGLAGDGGAFLLLVQA